MARTTMHDVTTPAPAAPAAGAGAPRRSLGPVVSLCRWLALRGPRQEGRAGDWLDAWNALRAAEPPGDRPRAGVGLALALGAGLVRELPGGWLRLTPAGRLAAGVVAS